MCHLNVAADVLFIFGFYVCILNGNVMNVEVAEKISTASSPELIKLSSSIETSNVSHKNNI